MIISENIDPFFIIYFIILNFLNIIKNLTEEVALYSWYYTQDSLRDKQIGRYSIKITPPPKNTPRKKTISVHSNVYPYTGRNSMCSTITYVQWESICGT